MTTPELKFPERPTCHIRLVPHFRPLEEPSWRGPRVGETFRTCYYCGSIHPEDLLHELTKGGATLTGSDWKYGWPHKFYVEGIKNPLVGQPRVAGSRSVDLPDGSVGREDIMGVHSPHLHAKWYNDHLLDQGYDEPTLNKLTDTIWRHSHILFTVEGDKLKYISPSPGYQR